MTTKTKTEARHDAADWRLPAREGGYRADAADPSERRVAERWRLEVEAAKHGVIVEAGMTDRAIHEAVAEKLMPGVFKFEGRREGHYAERAYQIAVEGAAAKAMAVEEASAAAAAAQDAARSATDGTGAAARADRADLTIRSSAELRTQRGAVRSSAELRARLARAPR